MFSTLHSDNHELTTEAQLKTVTLINADKYSKIKLHYRLLVLVDVEAKRLHDIFVNNTEIPYIIYVSPGSFH